jgi:hypothetical protein
LVFFFYLPFFLLLVRRREASTANGGRSQQQAAAISYLQPDSFDYHFSACPAAGWLADWLALPISPSTTTSVYMILYSLEFLFLYSV